MIGSACPSMYIQTQSRRRDFCNRLRVTVPAGDASQPFQDRHKATATTTLLILAGVSDLATLHVLFDLAWRDAVYETLEQKGGS
jgi:hypothetical protein